MTDFSLRKQQLLDLQHDLDERQRRIAAHNRTGVPADSEEQAVARGNDEVVAGLDQQITSELALIKAALTRIELGSYGMCVRCGAAITPARLTAVPFAVACSGCA